MEGHPCHSLSVFGLAPAALKQAQDGLVLQQKVFFLGGGGGGEL